MKKPRSFLFRWRAFTTTIVTVSLATITLVLSALPALADASQRPEIRAVLPDARLTGSARLSVWGFQVYQASLWTSPNFRAQDYAQHAFALELEYLRDFTGDAIAKRSIQEMRRVGSLTPEQADQWQTRLKVLIPDVKKGDRIIGINRPGAGAAFFVNGVASGEERNAEFARLFFGIWLSPQTSEPVLRQSLLSQAAP